MLLEAIGERARRAALAEGSAQATSPENRLASAVEDSSGESAKKSKRERTGTFTSGIVSTREGRRIAIFLSGHQHAGENLADVLRRRAAELKKAIRHRRNSLFYKTYHGAHVGDVFMSLIHTCELGGVNPFDYLTEIERHADRVAAAPRNWLPWNYRETLEAMNHGQASSQEGCQDK